MSDSFSIYKEVYIRKTRDACETLNLKVWKGLQKSGVYTKMACEEVNRKLLPI